MKHVTSVLCGLALALSVAPATRAAEGPGPRKVMYVIREEIKPARAAAHARAEEAYVRAFRTAKAPVYYVGLRAITGPTEAWFLSSYDSYEAWEKENDAIAKNPTLTRQLEAADEGDAGFRTGTKQLLLELMPDLGYRPRASVQDMRYIHATTIRLRPGFGRAFEEIRKLALAAHEKANVDEHWVVYQVVSGMPAGTYMMLSGSMSLKEDDTDPHTDAFKEALGEEGRKKQEQFNREAVISADTVSFEIAPQMSNVPDEWIKARPDFWKAPAMKSTMTATEPMAKPAVKPAANQ
jgi:hypothetical protein